jgi:hypothetical protein
MAYGNSNTSTSTPTQNRGPGGDGENGGREIYRVGDVTFTEEIPLDEDLLEDGLEDTPPSINGDIIFEKTIYSQKSFRQTVDTSISELKTQREEIDISKFFKHYNKVFFDIPKEGGESHTTLITTSKEFIENYIDPKDSIIDTLEEQVKDLEFELTRPDQVKEHPIFTNGTLIKEKGVEHSTQLMDQGYRRRVDWDSDMIAALKIAKYGTSIDISIAEITSEGIKSIPKGYPPVTIDNYSEPFDPDLNEINQRISSLRWNYLHEDIIEGEDAHAFNAHEFDLREDYLSRLSEAIENKQIVMERLRQYMKDYRSLIRPLIALDPDFFTENYGELIDQNGHFRDGTGGVTYTSDTDATNNEGRE